MSYDPSARFVGRLRCGRCAWLAYPETGQRATVVLRQHSRTCPSGAHPIGREYVFHEGADLDPALWAELVDRRHADPFLWLAEPQPTLAGVSPLEYLDKQGDPAVVIALLRSTDAIDQDPDLRSTEPVRESDNPP